MMFETVMQVGLIALTFSDAPWNFLVAHASWLVACMVALTLVPLHAQRPLSVLTLLASIACVEGGVLPPPPKGVAWLVKVVLPVKYLVSHLPRHEPYK
jgi:hypothetical protein